MDEEATAVEEETAESEGGRNGRGPGFVIGVVLGTLAGAAAATLFAPAAGDELEAGAQEPFTPRGDESDEPAGADGSQAEAPVERVRALLNRVRSRVHEAREEGRDAAQAAEAERKAHFEQLTHRN